jgi:hypothetical protein
MISFTIPTNLNGAQLVAELNADGVVVNDKCRVHDDLLWLDIAAKDKSKAEGIVASHIGIDTEPTIQDKLNQVGLNFDELKAALLIG